MQVNVAEFLKESGIEEPFYPGKRLVQPCKQTGQFKSHCVVFDWRDPDKIRIEVKAGLSGKEIEIDKLKYYPVCFQTPTYVDIEVVNDNEEEEEEGKSTSGKGGSGGKKPAKKKLSDMKMAMSNAFSDVMEGKVPEMGKIVEMVVLGKEMAADAYGAVMQSLAHQLSHAKVSATELLAKAGSLVTRFTPPAFMKPTGDETAVYKYDREKNESIGFNASLG